MQVVQADEAVFDAVEDKFAALTANLLPKLVRHTQRITLRRLFLACSRTHTQYIDMA